MVFVCKDVPCYYPIEAYQNSEGLIVFSERGKILRVLNIPCGRCIGCRLERSRQWAMRIMHESQMHERNSFITLTYDDEHLPQHGQLIYRHFQLFMKRLRKENKNVRFFMAGEYGESSWRPHFHACMFNYRPVDLVDYKKSAAGSMVYSSPSLAAIWQQGFASVGELTFESAAYVARYCLKKVSGRDADAHYTRVDDATGEIYKLEPEFAHMSLKPGIGASWFKKYNSDVYEHDRVIMRGLKMQPPKYYDKLLLKLRPESHEFVIGQRQLRERQEGECSEPRLRAREQVVKARLAFKERCLK